ncbi:MAG: FIST C-terminal domain-containing protein [bacterium]|nr:FIST C-terminal domain-containing protein [bacterium]
MKAKLYHYENNEIKALVSEIDEFIVEPSLVLVFGENEIISSEMLWIDIKKKFTNSHIVYCSTAGEISGSDVKENMAVITALYFENTPIKTALINIKAYQNSTLAGQALASILNVEGLKYVLLLSDGALVNASQLISGMEVVYNGNIPITGGLAGDRENFATTLVGLNNLPESGNIAAIGFYGDSLQIGHGSMGGWDVFGPEKTITKSEGNILFEIDGKNAMAIYRDYLGKYADELPGSALLFPLAIKDGESDELLVRTILSIDNENQSMVFAGEVPEGTKVRFMKVNFDNLIEAASIAAKKSVFDFGELKPDYALLISCVGRKLILKHRIEEELEAVLDVFDATVMSGFYSYGELSPFTKNGVCQLHNQTMTITTFTEIL